MSSMITGLSEVLADTYALYLKTQNFHWNVTGPTFRMLHLLFDEQYDELADAVDTIAERIRALGAKAPASFSAYQKTTKIKEGNINATASEMLHELVTDNHYLVEKLKQVHHIAEETSDVATASLLEDRMLKHDKAHWMLLAHCTE